MGIKPEEIELFAEGLMLLKISNDNFLEMDQKQQAQAMAQQLSSHTQAISKEQMEKELSGNMDSVIKSVKERNQHIEKLIKKITHQ